MNKKFNSEAGWLEYPSSNLWKRRRKWFTALNDSYEGEESYLVSDQACALIGEVETCFCAGAWLAVITLALSVVDAQLRETVLPEFKGNTKKLMESAQVNPALQLLRVRRNSIIHIEVSNPAITVDQQWDNRIILEKEARQAIKLMFEAFYSDPGL